VFKKGYALIPVYDSLLVRGVKEGQTPLSPISPPFPLTRGRGINLIKGRSPF